MRPMIVVAGEALIDLVVQPDGTVSAHPGGGPYTTARAIGRLGVPVAFLGRISDDVFGQRLARGLDEAGVDRRLSVPTTDPTTLAVAELDGGGSARYRFYLDGTSAPGLRADDLPPLPRDVSAVHVGTLGLVLEPTATTLESLVLDASDPTLVFVDVNARPAALRDPERWRARIERLATRADVVKASLEDLAVLAPGRDPLDAAQDLVARGVRVVLATAGGDPARIVTRDRVTAVAVPMVEVVDTVGAGDAFGGGFLAAWLAEGRGRPELDDADALRSAAGFAVVVAALACTRPGADPPTRAEVTAWAGAGYPSRP